MLSAECFCFPITCDYGVYGDFPCFSDHCDDVGSRERRRFLDLLPLLRVSHSDISGSEDSCGTAALGCADNCSILLRASAVDFGFCFRLRRSCAITAILPRSLRVSSELGCALCARCGKSCVNESCC